MQLSDAGLVTLPPRDYGRTAAPGHRNLYQKILRTPHNVVPEPRPDLVAWKPVSIDPNGRVSDLQGAADDALATLDRMGPRGAAALGATAGFVFASNRVFGALAGGVLGYFGGAYFVKMAKQFLAAQQVVAVVAPAKLAK